MPGEDEGTEAKTGAEGEGEPNASGPFVEDPGAPVESETSETGETGEASEPTPEPHPQPCLKVRPTPRPCLNVYRK